jgi:hypothetical protein
MLTMNLILSNFAVQKEGPSTMGFWNSQRLMGKRPFGCCSLKRGHFGAFVIIKTAVCTVAAK